MNIMRDRKHVVLYSVQDRGSRHGLPGGRAKRARNKAEQCSHGPWRGNNMSQTVQETETVGSQTINLELKIERNTEAHCSSHRQVYFARIT